MRKNIQKGLMNIFCGVGGEIIVLALGIIVPRFILKSYGDEANGLINAISQIFVYLSLIESGIGTSTVKALYKSIVNSDKESINIVLSESQKNYRKLAFVYFAFVLVFAFVYPIIVKNNDIKAAFFLGSQYWGIFLIILFQGISSVFNFYFIATFKQIMIADGRNYIIVNITTVFKVIISASKIILINIGLNLIILQCTYMIISLIEVLVYILVFKRKYSWIKICKKNDNSKILEDKKYFMIHELSSVVFSSTDMLVLSIFCDLTTVSIYSIYNLIFSALHSLISQAHSSCNYILGQKYNIDKEKYSKIHDLYNIIFITIVFIIMSIAYIMILPFVSLYTKDATEYNYLDNYLPILFCSIQLLSCSRTVDCTLISFSGHAKQTVIRTIIEAIINLSVSLILVNIIGIYGVLFGTIVALLYRTNDIIIYSNKKILNRSCWKEYKIILPNFIIFMMVVLFTYFVKFTVYNYLNLITYCFIFGIIFVLIYITINYLLNYHLIKLIFKKKI